MVFGSLANSFSLMHFYNKSGEGLGNVFLFLLNLSDLALSTVGIAVNLIPRLFKSSRELFLFGAIKTLAVFGVGADITRLITTYLCVIRTILVVKPLYRLHKRVIICSFLILVSAILGYRLFILVKFNISLGEMFYGCLYPSDENDECSLEKDLAEEWSIHEFVNITMISINMLIGTFCCILTLSHLLRPDQNLGANRTTDTNRKAAHTTLILSLICNVLNVASIGCSVNIATLDREKDEDTINSFIMAGFLNMQFVPLNSALNPIVYIVRTSALWERVRDIWRRVTESFTRIAAVSPGLSASA